MAEPQHPTSGQEDDKKSGGWGCLKIILALFAFFLLATIGAGYYVANSEIGKKVIQAAGEGYSIFKEAQSAPGADALRAAGCDEAAVFNLERLRTLVESFNSDGEGHFDADMDADAIVTCGMKSADSPPKCDALAIIYRDATSPKTDFGVVVKHRTTGTVNTNDGQVLCDGLYDAQGKRKSDLKDAQKTVPEK